MTELTNEEVRKILLDVIIEIDSICRENDIRYSLAGGTLLGAVRHKGFIPWDDDIDIFMPRPDYERFIDYCEVNQVGFYLLSNRSKDFGYCFAKACSNSTVIVEELVTYTDYSIGVYVDIFPIDGLGIEYKAALKRIKTVRFKHELLVASNWTRFFKSKTRSWIYEPIRLAFYCLSRIVNKNKLAISLDKKFKRIDFDLSGYAGAIMGSYGIKEIMPTEIYSKYMDIEFEGVKFKAIEDYDKYLSNLYGDYMKLPPIDKRISHHTFKAYLIE